MVDYILDLETFNMKAVRDFSGFLANKEKSDSLIQNSN